MPKRLGNTCSTDTVTATGAAMSINCGFRPTSVEIINRTQLVVAKWYASMTDAHAYVAIDDTGAGTGDSAWLTANGITPTFNGFIIGTAAQLNTTSDELHWVAHR